MCQEDKDDRTVCFGVIGRRNILRRAGPERATNIGLVARVDVNDARNASDHGATMDP